MVFLRAIECCSILFQEIPQLKTWLVFLVDCNRQTNKGRNWDITQSFLALALKNLSREELSAVRSVFFAM